MSSTTPPSQAHAKLIAAAYTVADEIAARAEKRLSGLHTRFRARVIVVVSGNARGPLGFFAAGKWHRDGDRFHEIHFNPGRSCTTAGLSSGEDAVVTLAHELAHLAAHEAGIRDTSNRGRYHSKKFARLAEALGCEAIRPVGSHFGFETPRLNAWGREAFLDLIPMMDNALALNAAPVTTVETVHAEAARATPAVSIPADKYVFASCGCVLPGGRRRTLRMASGQWPLSPVVCAGCGTSFLATGDAPESQPLWSTSAAVTDHPELPDSSDPAITTKENSHVR